METQLEIYIDCNKNSFKGGRHMKKNIAENSIRVFFIVLFTSVFLLFLVANGLMQKSNNAGNVIDIDKNVLFQINDKQPQKVNLSEYSFDFPEVGDTITITAVLPDTYVSQPVMMLNVYHSTVEVFLDGKNIYQYGQDLFKKGYTLGHGYFRIPLSDNYQGKELKIQLTVTEKDSYSSLEPIYIINSSESYTHLITDHFLTFMSSLTLITIGVVGLIASLSRKKYDRDTRTLTWISWFAIGMSVWMLCNDCLIYLIVPNFQMASIMEYYGVYTTVIPVALFFANAQSNMRYRNIFLGCAIFMIAANIVITVIHLCGGVHYIFWVPYIQIVMILLILFIIYTLFRSYRNESNQRVLTYGMIFMGFVVFFELIRFNLYKYLNGLFPISLSLMPIGTLIFVSSMIYSYCIKIIESYHDRAEQEFLEKLAYMDMLTNIFNRNKCEKIIDDMEEQRQPGYLINFDLNGLKYVNDNFGHTQGDILLKNFSEILRKTFQEKGIVGRMGGDEFLAVMYEVEENKVKDVLTNLDENITLWNTKHPDDKISVSYGYAYYNGEKHVKLRNVYEQADVHMYEYKKEIKKRDGIPCR